MLDGMSHSSTKVSQYTDFDRNSNNMYEKSRIDTVHSQQHKMVLRNGDEVDLTWLISSG